MKTLLSAVCMVGLSLGCGGLSGSKCGAGTSDQDGTCVSTATLGNAGSTGDPGAQSSNAGGASNDGGVALSCGPGTTEVDRVCVVDPAMGQAGADGQGGSAGFAGADGFGNAGTDPGPSEPEWTDERVLAAAEACDVGESGIAEPASLEEFESLLVREWYHCSGAIVNRAEPGNAEGLAFDADGTLQFLIADGEGGLARGTGFDNEGSWSALDNGVDTVTGEHYFQLNVSTPAGGNYLSVTFSTDPVKLHMIWMAGSAVYSALD